MALLRDLRPGRLLVGATGGAAALLALWLLHQADPGSPYPPYSYGDWAIRNTPGDFATWAIEELGKNARQGIAAGFSVAFVGLAALAAAFVHRWAPAAIAGGVTVLGAWLQPIEASRGDAALAAVVAMTAAGLVALLDASSATAAPRGQQQANRRRRLLIAGGLSAGMLALAIAAGIERAGRETGTMAVRIARRLAPRPDPAFDALPDLSRQITAPEDHYVIDINLQRPIVDGGSWRLQVSGEVEEERRLRFEEIVALGAEERAIHLQCISNNVGGDLAGTAAWAVVPLTKVLALARPTSSASTVVVKAFDGYHESYDLAAAGDILVAVAMGGLSIPDTHGFPVRLLYPGHYGMRSVKWVVALELTDGSRGDSPGYWQVRGWDDVAPLRIGSRIDTPKSGAQPERGVTVAGVAWGPGPITKVELSTDDGDTWPVVAELEPVADERAWVRWKAALDLAPGEYDVRARAHTADDVQTGEYEYPHPRGAAGYDLRIVKIS